MQRRAASASPSRRASGARGPRSSMTSFHGALRSVSSTGGKSRWREPWRATWRRSFDRMVNLSSSRSPCIEAVCSSAGSINRRWSPANLPRRLAFAPIRIF